MAFAGLCCRRRTWGGEKILDALTDLKGESIVHLEHHNVANHSSALVILQRPGSVVKALNESILDRGRSPELHTVVDVFFGGCLDEVSNLEWDGSEVVSSAEAQGRW